MIASIIYSISLLYNISDNFDASSQSFVFSAVEIKTQILNHFMEYRKLGNTDLEVSVICLGTMTFGEQNTEAEAHEQMDYALEQGVNFIDTAELYAVPSREYNNGLTEKYIGTWLKDRTDRDKIIVATKVTGPAQSKGALGYIRDSLDFSRTQIRAAIEGSLKRLQTDYVDLYQLHWPERKTNFFGRLGYTHREDDPWQDNFFRHSRNNANIGR